METHAHVFDVRVVQIDQPTPDVRLLTLSPIASDKLPDSIAGAHVDLFMPNGAIRPYSLLTPQTAPSCYQVAVKRSAESRGGSAFVHGHLRIGMELKVGRPRNTFPLFEDARRSIFVAGGIGITPILSMIRRISPLDRRWKLFYAYGCEQNALFRSELGMHDCVEFFPGGRNQTSGLKLRQVIPDADSDVHLYCCGPASLLEEFKELTADRAKDTVHLESFGSPVAVDDGREFKVRLARSNLLLTVTPGVTILEALRKCGVNAAYSCQEGLCGACEVGVLAGTPDHRDTVLSLEERSAGDKMMICCSRSLSDELVLDL